MVTHNAERWGNRFWLCENDTKFMKQIVILKDTIEKLKIENLLKVKYDFYKNLKELILKNGTCILLLFLIATC